MDVERQAEMPFFESAEDASYSAILKSKKSPKELAHALWPSLKMDTAYARLMGSLRHARPEKLTADEHIFIANFCGAYDYLYYIEIQCHHAGSQPIEPADEKAELQRQFMRSVGDLKLLASRIKSIDGST